MAAPGGVNPSKSPPIVLPFSFVFMGLLVFTTIGPFLVWKAPMIFGPFRFNPMTLTAVHLFTLGFATMVMMGAFYQLGPVLLLSDAPNWKLGLIEGILYVVGATIQITGFYLYIPKLIITGGSMVITAMTLFVILILMAMRTSKSWNITGTFMISGMAFLIGVASWGLTLAFNLQYNFLGSTTDPKVLIAHLVLGVGGWFMCTILGVSYQLIPMFGLSHRLNDKLAKWVFWLVTVGLWVAFLACSPHLLGLPVGVPLLAVLAGAVIYLYDVVGILRRRKRPKLDLGLRYSVTSLGFLALDLLLAVLTFSGMVPPLENTPGPTAVIWFAFFGFVAMMIMGMLYKIVPFLTWHRRFKNRNGKQKVPTFGEMYSQKVGYTAYWVYMAGVLITGLVLVAGATGLLSMPGDVAQWTAIVMAVGIVLYVVTMVQALTAS